MERQTPPTRQITQIAALEDRSNLKMSNKCQKEKPNQKIEIGKQVRKAGKQPETATLEVKMNGMRVREMN